MSMFDDEEVNLGLGLASGRLDLIVLHDGTTMQTHGARLCLNEFCCVHNPSDHPLNTAPLMWRGDRLPPLMERRCPHGIGHPDPDSLAYLKSVLGREASRYLDTHSCDGCCHS